MNEEKKDEFIFSEDEFFNNFDKKTPKEYEKRLEYLEYLTKEIELCVRITAGRRLIKIIKNPNKTKDQLFEYSVMSKRFEFSYFSNFDIGEEDVVAQDLKETHGKK